MSGTKAPIFSVKKVGFVIPKNKLAGSLVPVFRGAKKPGPNDGFSGGDETTKHAPRSTKWGPDLTLDPDVRKARALAYQTRVEQITAQLKSGMSENSDLELAVQHQCQDQESSGRENYTEKLEQLELEKREAIGEILKLNPSYKVPLDYKPVLKEDSVFIPVKEYPGYNFVGLIFGHQGDNQKHLEKETGAKIQLFGSKAQSSQKIQIKPSDSHESRDAYEELQVRISADTYEKVDATIAVIELLITSVSENLAAASVTPTSTVTKDTRIPSSQGVAGPTTQPPPQGQPGYPNHWFPSGPPVSTTPNTMAAHILPPSFRSAPNMPSLFNSNPQNLSFINSHPPPHQVLQHHPVTVGPPRIPSPIPPPALINAPPASLGFPSRPLPNFAPPEPHFPTAPNPGSFDFRHLGPQTIPRPHYPMHETLSPLPGPNFAPQSFNHGFQRPPTPPTLQPMVGNNMGPPQPQVFLRNPTQLPVPSGLSPFPDGGSGIRNFGPNPQVPVFPGPSRPGNHVQRPQFSANLPFGSGRPVSDQQLYDPFSPTSMPIMPRQQGGMWRR